MEDQKEVEQKILETLDKFRGESRFTNFGISRLLSLIGKIQGQEKLEQILDNQELIRTSMNTDGLTPPEYVYNFINEISKIIDPSIHLDPWLTLYSPSNFYNFGKTTAYCVNQNSVEVIKQIFPNSNAQISLGDSSKYLSETNDRFDFITCFPPFGVRKDKTKFGEHEFSNVYSTILLLQASKLLNENGSTIFLMPSSFVSEQNNKKLVLKLGLFVDAIFSIPKGALLQTNISSNLVIVTKVIKETTFVSEISKDENSNNIILENYKNRRNGKIIQLGLLVEFSEFMSFDALLIQNELLKLVKQLGYPQISLIDVAIEINILKEKSAEDVSHLPNSIYLPKIGNSTAVTTPSEMRMKNPKNYFQIQFDETKVNATFAANFFNSETGKVLRESLVYGATIPSISKSALETCILYLPDLDTQTKIVEVDSKIGQFSLRLEELNRKLWKYPKSYTGIAKELKTINKEEKLEQWIDNLPFPISSILWLYYASNENGKKVEYLLSFFEAFSELFSMIMLSGLSQDDEFYRQECHNWIGTDEKYKDWYLKSTFGSWNVLTSKLSKSIRKYYSEPKTKEFCESLFGNPPEAFMKMITEKGIINILDVARDIRNKQTAHTGISSEEGDRRIVAMLEQNLNELRKYIADGFEESKIVSSATKGELDENIYTFSVKELVGARSPFREIEIKSRKGLDKKKLYLTHSNQSKPVELLPFIKFIEDTNAIYFYMSVESENVRWVSYHFKKNNEIKQPIDSTLSKAFEFLK